MHLHGSNGRTLPNVNTTQVREKTWHNLFYFYSWLQPFFVSFYSIYSVLKLEKGERSFMNRGISWVVPKCQPLFPLSLPHHCWQEGNGSCWRTAYTHFKGHNSLWGKKKNKQNLSFSQFRCCLASGSVHLLKLAGAAFFTSIWMHKHSYV